MNEFHRTHRSLRLASTTILTTLALAASACEPVNDDRQPVGEECPPRVAIPRIEFQPPSIACVGDQSVIEFSSDNGQPDYQPGDDQCVRITDASGNLVAPYADPGDPYLTPIYSSPPLTLTPGASYTIEIVSCSTGVHAYPTNSVWPWANVTLTAPSCDPDSGMGMTWGTYRVDPITGVLQVGCQPANATGDCDAYHGDTSCSTELPVLCKRVLGLPQPATFTWPPDATHVWSGNVVATTPPIAPATAGLTTRAAVNAYCAAEFGPGWEVAEHHDGWGWNFTAYGNVGTAPRFWVDIDDQPDATCW